MTDRKKREFTPEEKAEADRRFFARLTDWSEPGAITMIRDGMPLNPTAPVEPTRPPPTVVSVDDYGTFIMSDGTNGAPRPPPAAAGASP